MREHRRIAAALGVLVLVLVSACSSGTKKKGEEHHAAPALGTAWATAHFKTLGGIQGRFRSEVLARACTQPPTQPCAVGGAAVVDSGFFTEHDDSSSYLHVAFGIDADSTELAGYRVRYTTRGETYIQHVGGGRDARCWTPVPRHDALGSDWGYLPAWDVLNDAEPVQDPPVGKGVTELVGHAPAQDVLGYLKVSDIDSDGHFDMDVPVHLRLDRKGRPAGFWIDGEEVAIALVGRPPKSTESTNPTALVTAEDPEYAERVRALLIPMHGDFRMTLTDSVPEVVAPPPGLLLTPAQKHRHQTCAAGR